MRPRLENKTPNLTGTERLSWDARGGLGERGGG